VVTGWPLCSLAAPPYAGRSVQSVLLELQERGLRLIYNDEIVPGTLRVESEPAFSSDRELLEQVLAQHGLTTRAIGSGSFAIVPAPPTAAAAAGRTPAQTGPAPLEEIVVASSRYLLSTQVPDVQTMFTQSEMEALPRLADDSLKAVQRLPSAASNGLSGLAYMRGGEQNETRILFDGLSLYQPFHLRLLQSPVSVLDPRIVEDVSVHAGGFTADLGDAMSTVIEARSVEPAEEDHYEAGLSLFHVNALAARHFADGRGQWLVSARRSNLEEVADLLDSDLGEPSYMDAYARATFEFSDVTRASMQTLFATDSVLALNSDDTELAKAHYRNLYVWGMLEHDWDPRTSGRAVLSFTDVNSEREGAVNEPASAVGLVDDRRDYDVLGLRLDGSWTGERWLHRFGAEARMLSARYRYLGSVIFESVPMIPGIPTVPLERRLEPEPSGERYGAYVTSRVRLSDSLTGELGLRWDWQSFSDEGAGPLSPRLGLVWELGNETRIRASWGRYSQLEGIEELQVEDGIDSFRPAERSEHAIIGIETVLPWGVAARIETYRKDYDRLRPRYENLFDPLSLVPELRWDRVEIAPSAARAEGVEMLVAKRDRADWSGWLSYTWSRVEDRVNGADVARSWDQTHALGGGVTWNAGDWQATAAGSYHTGWPVTAVQTTRTPEGERVLLGPRNGSRYPDFASIDLKLSRDFALRHGKLSAFVELTNALNRRNPCCIDFEIRTDADGKLVLQQEYRHWLPLVPSFGVLWQY
jgi:outer membrane receptor protein involved in Fe transport